MFDDGIRGHVYLSCLLGGCLGRGRANRVIMDQGAPILVVEDNPELRELIGLQLSFEHFRVALTANGQEALDWLALQRPDLLILDWRLPLVGGDRVLAGTRERYGDQVPILVLSAAADSFEARLASADAYLLKPYFMDDLVNTIHRLLTA